MPAAAAEEGDLETLLCANGSHARGQSVARIDTPTEPLFLAQHFLDRSPKPTSNQGTCIL